MHQQVLLLLLLSACLCGGGGCLCDGGGADGHFAPVVLPVVLQQEQLLAVPLQRQAMFHRPHLQLHHQLWLLLLLGPARQRVFQPQEQEQQQQQRLHRSHQASRRRPGAV